MPDQIICISLSKGFETVIDAENADLGAAANWYALTSKYSQPYAFGYVRGTKKHQLLHILIIEKAMGRTLLPHEYCDHIDRDSLNNRLVNLRVVTARESSINRGVRKDARSGYTGIGWHKHHEQWQVRINVAVGIRKTIGYFDDLSDAIVARDEAVKAVYGEFAPMEVSHAAAAD